MEESIKENIKIYVLFIVLFISFAFIMSCMYKSCNNTTDIETYLSSVHIGDDISPNILNQAQLYSRNAKSYKYTITGYKCWIFTVENNKITNIEKFNPYFHGDY